MGYKPSSKAEFYYLKCGGGGVGGGGGAFTSEGRRSSPGEVGSSLPRNQKVHNNGYAWIFYKMYILSVFAWLMSFVTVSRGRC